MAAPRRKKKRHAGAAQPPPGTYDPALDAALGAAKRGYGDLKADFTRDFGATGTGGRMGNDYQFGLSQIGLGRTRLAQDVATGRARATENRDTALQDVKMQYGRLQRQQGERQRQMGDLSGGLALRAAQIRATNQGHDEQPINTAFERQMQDFSSSLTRGNQDFDTQQGQLGLNYSRGLQDARTNLSRAGRETKQFGVDTAQSRLYQATQAGYTAPGRPRRRKRRVSMAVYRPQRQPQMQARLG